MLANRTHFYVSFNIPSPALLYLDSSLHRCVAHICSHMTTAWTGDIYLRQGTAIKDHHPGKPDKICNLRRAYLRTYMRRCGGAWKINSHLSFLFHIVFIHVLWLVETGAGYVSDKHSQIPGDMGVTSTAQTSQPLPAKIRSIILKPSFSASCFTLVQACETVTPSSLKLW